jgi:hypothetical protein
MGVKKELQTLGNQFRIKKRIIDGKQENLDLPQSQSQSYERRKRKMR